MILPFYNLITVINTADTNIFGDVIFYFETPQLIAQVAPTVSKFTLLKYEVNLEITKGLHIIRNILVSDEHEKAKLQRLKTNLTAFDITLYNLTSKIIEEGTKYHGDFYFI